MMLKQPTGSAAIIGWLLAISLACAQPAVAKSPHNAGFNPERLERIDSAINAEIAAGKIPGAVALVARNGNIVFHKSFGVADLKTGTPMQIGSIFRIASMTKAITTTAVMMLYEQGHFQLNDPLAKYIPAFADMRVLTGVDEAGKTTTTAASKPIRIIDLLTHTSGIGYPFMHSSVQKIYHAAGVIDGLTARDINLQSQMLLLARQPLMFEPGSEWAYGLSADLLGYLVEVISGKSLERFFAEDIFAPLGMQDSYFYIPAAKAKRLVTLYGDFKGQGLVVLEASDTGFIRENPRYPVEGAHSYFSGGAGLSSTTQDFARFCQMLLNDGAFEGTRLLSRKSVELMHTPRADINQDGKADFGLGFWINTDPAQTGELGSTGAYSWGGAFSTSFWIDPDENLVGVFMTQVRPVQSDIRARFKTLVYQALE